MNKSKCCQAKCRIGYYNKSTRPDIHGISLKNEWIAHGLVGTYCTACDKLCDYFSGHEEYFTNGIKKSNVITT